MGVCVWGGDLLCRHEKNIKQIKGAVKMCL